MIGKGYFYMDSIREIYHLGGTRTASFEPGGAGCKFDSSNYFYERIPLKINGKEGHVYGEYLEKCVKEWIRETKNDKTTLDFQTWMAQKSDSALEKRCVRYLNDEERAQTEVTVKQGVLEQIGLDSSGRSRPLSSGTYAFVIGDVLAPDESRLLRPTTRLYAGPKGLTENGLLQHSSFLRGGSVRSAGMFEVDAEGRIVSVRNQSGHYKPSAKELAYFIDYLSERGYDTSKMRVEYSRNWFFRLLFFLFGAPAANKWHEKMGKQFSEAHTAVR